MWALRLCAPPFFGVGTTLDPCPTEPPCGLFVPTAGGPKRQGAGDGNSGNSGGRPPSRPGEGERGGSPGKMGEFGGRSQAARASLRPLSARSCAQVANGLEGQSCSSELHIFRATPGGPEVAQPSAFPAERPRSPSALAPGEFSSGSWDQGWGTQAWQCSRVGQGQHPEGCLVHLPDPPRPSTDLTQAQRGTATSPRSQSQPESTPRLEMLVLLASKDGEASVPLAGATLALYPSHSSIPAPDFPPPTISTRWAGVGAEGEKPPGCPSLPASHTPCSTSRLCPAAEGRPAGEVQPHGHPQGLPLSLAGVHQLPGLPERWQKSHPQPC